jgi:ribosomal protein L3
MGKTLPCIKTKHNLGKQKGTSGKSKKWKYKEKQQKHKQELSQEALTLIETKQHVFDLFQSIL